MDTFIEDWLLSLIGGGLARFQAKRTGLTMANLKEAEYFKKEDGPFHQARRQDLLESLDNQRCFQWKYQRLGPQA